jgi:hypothetical protein
MIGEIAARLSGGYMSGWTYPYASGVNPARGAIQIALGLKPNKLKPIKNHTGAERAFISIPGLVKSIEGLDEARNTPHIKDIFLRLAKNSRVSFPENNVSKAGNVISAAKNRETAVHAAEEAARKILIRLSYPDEETEAFLKNAKGCTACSRVHLEMRHGGSPKKNATVRKMREDFSLSSGRREERCAAESFPPSAYVLNEDLYAQLSQIAPGIDPSFFTTNQHEPTRTGTIAIAAFPGFVESGLKDYAGRSPRESLEAVKKLTGLDLSEANDRQKPVLGREFWQALIRGGYQGAVYYVDKLNADYKIQGKKHES